MSNICLVIGNGFDLDLGLKSKYKDYFESKEFEEAFNDVSKDITHLQSQEDSLMYRLKTQVQIEQWIDLESELSIFTDDFYSQFSDFLNDNINNKTRFHQFELFKIHDSLLKYLKRITSEHIINKDSVAYALICMLQNKIRSGLSLEIINYNYTSIPDIRSSIPVTYVHGSVFNEDIIIGISDKHKINKGHAPFIKSHNQHYKSSNVRSKLKAADIIIFFGHSLGQSDYHYFDEFFKEQSTVDTTKGMRNKYIYIFTFDETSRQNILWDLRVMNDSNVNMLYDLNKFQVIKVRDLKDSKTDFLTLMMEDINQLKIKSQSRSASISLM